VIAVTAAVIGWFYLRNIRLTGNWAGAQPEWAIAHLGRSRRSLADTLAMPELWLNFRRLFWQPKTSLRWLGPLVLALLAVSAAMGAIARRPWRQANVVGVAVCAVVTAQFIGTIAMQAIHTTQGGSIPPDTCCPRYCRSPLCSQPGRWLGVGCGYTR